MTQSKAARTKGAMLDLSVHPYSVGGNGSDDLVVLTYTLPGRFLIVRGQVLPKSDVVGACREWMDDFPPLVDDVLVVRVPGAVSSSESRRLVNLGVDVRQHESESGSSSEFVGSPTDSDYVPGFPGERAIDRFTLDFARHLSEAVERHGADADVADEVWNNVMPYFGSRPGAARSVDDVMHLVDAALNREPDRPSVVT